MDRMLVVVFDSENKAYEGLKALQELDLHGSITVYRHAVVVRKPDGTTTVGQCDDLGPSGLVKGLALGGFLGALGGPLGLAIGATVGSIAGGAVDLKNARVGADFIDEIAKALGPSRTAVVAEIEEGSTDALDSRMEALGGTVFRRALSEVKHTLHEEHIAALQADLAQIKAEHAQAHVQRKAKLQEKINQLDAKLQFYLQRANERRTAAEREARAKVELLQRKAAAAKAAETHLHQIHQKGVTP